MKAYRCLSSGEVSVRPFPPGVCSESQIEAVDLSGKGTVYSCTTLHAAAERFEPELPFQLAIIELEEGPRLTGRIEGARVKIGDRVIALGERNGVWFFTGEPVAREP